MRQGESTARMKWSEAEASKFKEALAKFGPDSNIKIAAAIGTRTAAQVNVFKWRFLRANPSWLQQNYHPAPTTANAPSARCSSASPRLTPEDRSPPDSRTTQRPPAANTRSSRSSSATSESHTPPGPSTTRRQRTTGTRALPAPPAPTRQRHGPPPTSSTLPAAPPPSLAVQQLAPGSPTPTASPQAAVSAVMQYYSPGGRVAQHNQEEGTPSPLSAPLTEETVSRLRRLDEHLQTLRATAPDTPDPDAPGSTPPQAELLSPGREEGTQSPMPASRPATQEEGTPSPPPAPLLEETALRLQHADEVLKKLRASAVARWEPEPTDFPSLAQKSQEERIPLPPAADTLDEGTIRPQPREEALAILGLENIHLWDPEEEILSPTLLACIATPPASPLLEASSERQHSSPGAYVDLPMSPMAAGERPATPSVHAPIPPPSIFRSLLHVPPFIPARPQTDAPTRESAPPTTPSSPRAGVPERSEAHQPPPPVPTSTGRLSIDPDNLDETMRLPFYRELEPLAGRQLGTFEWVAFEEVLCRWSAAIKEIVDKQQQRPSNPTSHWARRQRRRDSRPGMRPPSPNRAATSPPTAPSSEPGWTDGQGGGDAVGNRRYRTPGIA